MSSMWGNKIRISIFGESHGPAIGVTIDGLPAGEVIDTEEIKRQMSRRAPGSAVGSTARTEDDIPEILSGLLDGVVTGAPLTAIIRNKDKRSNDYANLTEIPRPGHADYTADIRYNGFNDIRGGGHFSGRLTAPLVFAGAVCRQILESNGINIGAHIFEIHGCKDEHLDSVFVNEETLKTLQNMPFPVINERAGEKMKSEIAKAASSGDSVGGIIECAVTGMLPGIGDHMFDGIENRISSIMFGIPAVKGIEFGAGFGVAELYGSENNDRYILDDENDEIRTVTNNAGGILGGISNGMPIIFRVAVKPTPSIAKPQMTLNCETLTEEELVIRGRHDSCILTRAVPVVESAAAVALLDMIM